MKVERLKCKRIASGIYTATNEAGIDLEFIRQDDGSWNLYRVREDRYPEWLQFFWSKRAAVEAGASITLEDFE